MEIPSLRISPNPAPQGQIITIGMFNEFSDQFNIELADLGGNEIIKQIVTDTIVILENLSTENLGKGTYVLKVNSRCFSAIRHIQII